MLLTCKYMYSLLFLAKPCRGNTYIPDNEITVAPVIFFTVEQMLYFWSRKKNVYHLKENTNLNNHSIKIKSVANRQTKII